MEEAAPLSEEEEAAEEEEEAAEEETREAEPADTPTPGRNRSGVPGEGVPGRGSR